MHGDVEKTNYWHLRREKCKRHAKVFQRAKQRSSLVCVCVGVWACAHKACGCMWQKTCTRISVSCRGCVRTTMNHRKHTHFKYLSALHAVGASTSVSLDDTIMGCSRLLLLGLILNVSHCLETGGKSAGLQPICVCQLFMGLFYWTFRSYLTCGIYTQECCCNFPP